MGSIIGCRLKFYSFLFISLFLWASFLTSILLVVCLPVLASAVSLVLFDRNFNTSFFDVLGGGDLILFQHLFWFFGHPEVYIIIIPIFGLISIINEFNFNRIVFSYIAMVISMTSICVIGFFVWAHHMFTVGMDIDTRLYFGVITVIIGVPTCIKIFN
jgi:heme/copper-type cytochrome/quinol oxidase subunit 1